MNEDPPRIVVRTSRAARAAHARSRVSAGEAFSVGFFGGLGYALSRFCVFIAVTVVLFTVLAGIVMVANMLDSKTDKNSSVESHQPRPPRVERTLPLTAPARRR